MICFPFHKWSRWSDVFPMRSVLGGQALTQVRHCHRCGKADSRNAGWIDLDEESDESSLP